MVTAFDPIPVLEDEAEPEPEKAVLDRVVGVPGALLVKDGGDAADDAVVGLEPGEIGADIGALRQDALVVINRSVTARAWLTGYYIVEYEQCGRDRAKYGEGLLKISAEALFNRLSYSHIRELVRLNDDLQRTFYAFEAIRGTWSVRELQRQIESLYYARSGWSKNPHKLS